MEAQNQYEEYKSLENRFASNVRYILTAKNLLETPDEQWVRENGRVASQVDRLSPKFELSVRRYNAEYKIFKLLEQFYFSLIGLCPLPIVSEVEVMDLFIRFPQCQISLEYHLDLSPPGIMIYCNALMTLASQRGYHELSYVLESAQKDMEVPIPYNDQFQAVRHVPQEVVVPPQPEGYVDVDHRTWVNKTPTEVPDPLVSVVSAQCEVDLAQPLAVVFDVLDDDIKLKRKSWKRYRWDQNGTTPTMAPIGLYSGYNLVRFEEGIGIRRDREYIMLQDGVLKYATPNCYVTVFCDGQHIRSRDQYVFADTTHFGNWRYEVFSRRLLCQVAGESNTYAEIQEKIVLAQKYRDKMNLLVGIPRSISGIVWTIRFDDQVVFLGRNVKRNKILARLKVMGITNVKDYFDIFIHSFSGCVYYGNRRLLVGECKKWVPLRTEHKRYPSYYAQLHANENLNSENG